MEREIADPIVPPLPVQDGPGRCSEIPPSQALNAAVSGAHKPAFLFHRK